VWELALPYAWGGLFAAAIALAAWRARSLTVDGACAAFVVGTATFGSGGWAATIVLLAFFASSVGFSRLGKARKRALGDIAKGGPRDAMQVLANGGAATVCIVFARIDLAHAAAWLAGFATGYAAATADTWSTEIGTLARGTPRSILTGAPIATGLSGGVSVQGTLAALGGAIWIALAAAATGYGLAVAAIVAILGFGGALFDSVLGAAAQVLRWCPACERACENDPHVCGTRTTRLRGFAWLDNDGVNFAATALPAALAVVVALR
jgi:uncharacterized protein (TIGR00297 family)